jgi:hypothetical protein
VHTVDKAVVSACMHMLHTSQCQSGVVVSEAIVNR